jgi:hypothetical protein
MKSAPPKNSNAFKTAAKLAAVAAAVPKVAAAPLNSTALDFTSPFMGWSSFSGQASKAAGYGQAWLTEGTVKGISAAMDEKLGAAGYRYVNLDSGWNADLNWSNWRYDDHGVPAPDPQRFPGGMKALADHLHARGQKLGLYFTVGLEKTPYWRNYPIEGTACRTSEIAKKPEQDVPNGWGSQVQIDWSNPCAQAYYDSVAHRMASWGVDLLKIDGITRESVDDVAAWQKAIDKTGRQIWLTASAWPVPHAIAAALGDNANSVRVDTDIECYCETVSTWTASVRERWSDLPKWLEHVRPGHWADLDAMPVNNNRNPGLQDGINDAERGSVMALWSIASAPLYVGGDLTRMDDVARGILTNPELIEINQLGTLPRQLRGGEHQVWAKQLPDGSQVVALFNLGKGDGDVRVCFSELGIDVRNAQVRDLAARQELGSFDGAFNAAKIPSHGARIVRITPEGNERTAGQCSGASRNSAAYAAFAAALVAAITAQS